MKRWIRPIGVVLAVVAVAWVLRATACRPAPIEVEAVRVARGRVEDVVANSQAGTVRSRHRVKLAPEAGGTVVRIAREGEAVARGAVLVELDRVTAERQLELARRERQATAAAVDAAASAARLAARERERAETLGRQGLLPQGQLDEARSRAATANAELRAARARQAAAAAAVRVAEDGFSHLAVTAPFDGVIADRFVEPGETLNPAQPALELLSLDSLYVSAPIDETDVARLRVGLPARVSLDTHPGVRWQAVVRRVAPFVSDVQEQNRTLEIEVDVSSGPGQPIPPPGASADVEVVLDAHEDVLRLPTSALLEGDRVYRVVEGRAAAKPVEIGLRNWDWTEIRAGLAEGDVVVATLDRPGLADGVRVRVKERAAADSARATPP